ncbi:sensor histidine kinase [Paenibacillus faecalis]|uniref:sensor histidine kinase n=1 Tax=Paenibacillus faecalis TaxID=2079532 RepID=UPI000D10C597|nr:HAMP domain-containing sensor histidine kinase [Paenibacillus faecalis]
MFYIKLLFLPLFGLLVYLMYKRYLEKKRLLQLKKLLKEVKSGDYGRRGIIAPNDEYSEIYYLINEIIRKNQTDLLQINKLNEQNKRMLTSLSHDVKTPVASLLGYLEAIHKGIVNEEEKEEYFKVALDKAYKLKEYINQLFQLLQLESGEYKLRKQPCNICEETRRIFISWVPMLVKLSIEYTANIPDESIIITLDVDAYERILDNLIKNAAIHSKCEKISITLSEDEKLLQVMIDDDGIGIPENAKERIMDRLYKVDESRANEGSGLGLAIVKELSEKCDMSLEYTSEEGKGTSFILCIQKTP